MAGEEHAKKRHAGNGDLDSDTKALLAKKVKQSDVALSWDDDGVAAVRGLRIVVMLHMFRPQEAIESGDPDAFYSELEEDVLSEIQAKCGAVEKMTLFRGNSEGAVVVKFRSAAAADTCISLMHRRWFGGQQIDCQYYDGRTDYRVRASDDGNEEQRLESFGSWLEGHQEDEDKPTAIAGGSSQRNEEADDDMVSSDTDVEA